MRQRALPAPDGPGARRSCRRRCRARRRSRPAARRGCNETDTVERDPPGQPRPGHRPSRAAAGEECPARRRSAGSAPSICIRNAVETSVKGREEARRQRADGEHRAQTQVAADHFQRARPGSQTAMRWSAPRAPSRRRIQAAALRDVELSANRFDQCSTARRSAPSDLRVSIPASISTGSRARPPSTCKEREVNSGAAGAGPEQITRSAQSQHDQPRVGDDHHDDQVEADQHAVERA